LLKTGEARRRKNEKSPCLSDHTPPSFGAGNFYAHI
jgi:hypothetical protein